jgi:hypothetical protein
LKRIAASWAACLMIEGVRRFRSIQLPPRLGMSLEVHAVQCLGAQWDSNVRLKMLEAASEEAEPVFVVSLAEAQGCHTELS